MASSIFIRPFYSGAQPSMCENGIGHPDKGLGESRCLSSSMRCPQICKAPVQGRHSQVKVVGFWVDLTDVSSAKQRCMSGQRRQEHICQAFETLLVSFSRQEKSLVESYQHTQ